MTTPPAAPVRGKILVIDDNLIIQRAVYFALRDQGYKVLMCGTIADACKIVRTEKPDLVFVDLSFPPDATNIGGPMDDGFFFIAWIRRMPGVENTPILIISGTEPAKYQERIAGLGIKACLQKPLKKEDLVAAIETVLGGNAATGQPGQS